MWEKIFSNDTSDQGPLSEICKELLKLSNKKRNKLILKQFKDLNRHLTQKIYTDGKETYKKISHFMSSEKYKIKQLRNTTLHLLAWQKFTLIIPNAGKDVDQQEFSFFDRGNVKSYSSFR